MKLRVAWIGKTRDPNLAKLALDYSTRIGRFVPIETTEVKDPKIADDSRRIPEEGKRLLGALDKTDHVIVLDAGGRMWSSKELAAFLAQRLRQGPRQLTFVIGGPSGLSSEVKNRADVVWSLSPLTFTHEMCRVLVLEQLYRALAILHGHPYSK
jgi:23S rRNA (pseudouridine1915-N3)-methyltransferase